MILEAICEAGLSPHEVKDMVLVILSDMQIDEASEQDYGSVLQGRIKEEYAAAGQRMYGEDSCHPISYSGTYTQHQDFLR